MRRCYCPNGLRFVIGIIVSLHPAHVDHPQAPAGLGRLLNAVLQTLGWVDGPEKGYTPTTRAYRYSCQT